MGCLKNDLQQRTSAAAGAAGSSVACSWEGLQQYSNTCFATFLPWSRDQNSTGEM